jgi:serine/threonine protein kinase/tetratricopeptide (TPR) repeat protein
VSQRPSWPPLPYLVGGAVFDDHRFVGRTSALAKIKTFLSQPTSPGVLLQGPRRSGKSSMLKRLEHIAGGDVRVFFLDLLSILGHTNVWPPGTVAREVLAALVAAIEGDVGPLPDACKAPLEREQLDVPDFRRRALPELLRASASRRLLVLLDEMEVAQARDPAAPAMIASCLAPNIVRDIPRPFLGIVWGRAYGAGLPRDVPSMFKDFHKEHVAWFDPDDVATALMRPVEGFYGWSKPAVERVLECTAGHPLFVAAVGAAVHQQREPGSQAAVDPDEVDAALPASLVHAETWGDAWRQLQRSQKLFLRAVGEAEATPTLDDVVALVEGWGAGRYAATDFEPGLRGLVEDGIIANSARRYRFQVPLMRAWVRRIHPDEILGPDDPSAGTEADVLRHERSGLDLRAAGKLDEAVKELLAAIDLDPMRWRAAVLVAEILLQRDEPNEAVKVLRHATPCEEVRRLQAQALVRCLADALRAHEGADAWAQELLAIDPSHERAPDGAALIHRIETDRWWNAIRGLPPLEAVALTEQQVAPAGSARVLEALRRCRAAVQEGLDGHVQLRDVEPLVVHVMPRLLRWSIPVDTDDATDNRDEWQRCFLAGLTALERLATEPARLGGDGIPPEALAALLERPPPALRGRLIELVARLARADRLAELARFEPSAARVTAAVIEAVMEPQWASRTLSVGLTTAVTEVAQHGGDVAQLRHALTALPAIGQSLQRTQIQLGDAGGVFVQDAITGVDLLFERLATDPACADVLRDLSWRSDWQGLIETFRTMAPTDTTHLLSRLDRMLELPTALPPEGSAARPSGRITKEIVQDVLGGAYVVERATPYRITGVPTGYVAGFSVDRNGRHMLARAYKVGGGEPIVQEFLEQLWANERRLLSTLATRWEGRALPRLHVARLAPQHKVLVLLTDFVGPHTLRDYLESGEIARMARGSRSALWSHLQGLVDALAALHRGGYLHRAIRPESIMVDAKTNLGRPWLRLANFEWSVYLMGIASSPTPSVRTRDRYVAPEVLAIQRFDDQPAVVAGEGPGADIFALGLVMFECLVGPLHPKELEPVPRSYGQTQHVEWVKTLLARIDAAYHEKKLSMDEVFLLKDLLKPDLTNRCPSLDSIQPAVDKLARSAVASAGDPDAAPLPLVTTLQIGTKESIAHFIKEEIPVEGIGDVESLRRWLENELRDADVLPNRRAGAPLLVLGRSLNFTVEPFQFQGMEHRHIGWLKVAKEHDAPAGATIHRLRSGVHVHNYRRDMTLAPLLTSSEGWSRWFEVVGQLHDGLTTNEGAFVDRVRWSVELERDAWTHWVLPYTLVEHIPGKRPGDPDVAYIKDRSEPHRRGRYELADLMAQTIDRGNTWFDLGTSRDPIAVFHQHRRWVEDKSEEETGLIRLIRYRREEVTAPPPNVGWIRPYTMVGNRTLYNRRKEILADIERDPFLVRSIVTPEQTYDDLNLPPSRVFDRHLDDDKNILSTAMQNRRPLFVVQGPPGTGKTTLAAEVILRTLNDDPSARILVVSQAHDPLNNLLERVEGALTGWHNVVTGHKRTPTSVRLTSEERLDARRYGEEATRVVRRYHPSRVAARILEMTKQWRAGPEDISAPEAIEAWQRILHTQTLHGLSRSLEQRLVASTNIVYATANDRTLAGLQPGSFDLVIYEEAAKAFPVEVLGPMRLARRWIVIGDEKQLPPFGLQDVDEALTDAIHRLRLVHGEAGARPVGANPLGLEPHRILGERPPSSDVWAAIKKEMIDLLRFFGYVLARAARVPLHPPPDDRREPHVVKGLSGMLRTQWRMHPVIGDFVSHNFYQDRVHNGDPERLARWRKHNLTSPIEVKDNAILWIDTPWIGDNKLATERRGFGGGWENGLEARVVLGFVRQLMKPRRALPKIAILSPYRAQIRALERLCAKFQYQYSDLILNSLNTVDSFQGKQADVVVVSLVRNNFANVHAGEDPVRKGLGFLHAPERSTVLFSRAEKLLVVVGCMKHFGRFPETPIKGVVDHVRSLAGKRSSGVAITSARDFLEDKHWEDLASYHEDYARRRRRRDEQLGRPKEDPE